MVQLDPEERKAVDEIETKWQSYKPSFPELRRDQNKLECFSLASVLGLVILLLFMMFCSEVKLTCGRFPKFTCDRFPKLITGVTYNPSKISPATLSLHVLPACCCMLLHVAACLLYFAAYYCMCIACTNTCSVLQNALTYVDMAVSYAL